MSNVYRIAIGSMYRYARANSMQEARRIACIAWHKAAQRIGAVEAIGQACPDIGAAGYSAEVTRDDAALFRRMPRAAHKGGAAFNSFYSKAAEQATRASNRAADNARMIAELLNGTA
jgi:hypothetical protein